MKLEYDWKLSEISSKSFQSSTVGCGSTVGYHIPKFDSRLWSHSVVPRPILEELCLGSSLLMFAKPLAEVLGGRYADPTSMQYISYGHVWWLTVAVFSALNGYSGWNAERHSTARKWSHVRRLKTWFKLYRKRGGKMLNSRFNRFLFKYWVNDVSRLLHVSSRGGWRLYGAPAETWKGAPFYI